MASSLDAKTSIKEKSRSMTCMVGTTGVGASAFLMGLNLCLFESEGVFTP
jgi:ABC-type phosphate transport system ATPase subunit